MKQKDIFFILAFVILFLPFFLFEGVMDSYKTFNTQHGMIMSFVKFAILATLGEVIGLRIKTGSYSARGFGLLSRAIVWGFLGLTIQMAFIIFSAGTPAFLEYMGLKDAGLKLMQPGFTPSKLLVAFSISAALNLIYAPVMMTLHKITDSHIERNNGQLKGLLRPIAMGEIMQQINWKVQWNFVFKKTIPFFWIPAHTITFMLPPETRVLFAALLGIMLGILLAVAAVKGRV